jgi:hypothetical protein
MACGSFTFRSMILTMAEPEIAPAAPASIAAVTCSGAEMPKPCSGGAAWYSASFSIR